MARLEIELPDRFPFRTEIDVRITDLNYGAHLANDALLALVHEARVRFLRSHGYGELDIEGQSLIMTDAVVIYRAESFAGDRLCFEVAVGQLKRVTCDLFYRVTRMADARLIAEVKTGVAFRNPTTRKPVPLPALMHQLSAL